MTRFSMERVKLLHQMIAEETGGAIGVRDEGLLDSALEGIFQSFAGKELYPAKEEKGARLGYTLISNHSKCIGMHVMLTFLEVNGMPLSCTADEIIKIGLGVADGSISYDQLLDWVITHKA